MSNTSDEWKKTSENLKSKIGEVKNNISSLDFAIADNNAQIASLVGASFRLKSDDPSRETIKETVRQLNNQNIKLNSRKGEFDIQLSDLNLGINDSNNNINTLEKNPPNTTSVPQPASSNPGDNTDVNITNNDNLNVSVDQNITPNSDPYFNSAIFNDTQLENPVDQGQISVAEEFGPQESIGLDSREQVQEREFERLRQEQISQNAEQLRLEAANLQEDEDAQLRQAQREEGEAVLAGLPPPIRESQIEVDTGLTGTPSGIQRQREVEVDTGLYSTAENEMLQAQSEEGRAIADGIREQELLQAQREEGEAILAGIKEAQKKAPAEATINWKSKNDWRVRLSLTPEANYLYKAPDPGILAPLKETDGVLFPYLPSISVSYSAQYNSDNLTHNNYTLHSYSGSSVGTVSISCDFTAQDTFEANYLLAVIHFFRSMTKMFYGKDQNPKLGTPPPLCYLFGMGEFQFNAHPLVITSFQYSLPTDVDYIRTNSARFLPGANQGGLVTKSNSTERLTGVGPGGKPMPAKFNNMQTGENITYVPTHMSLSINAHPIVSRNDISNNFSLRDYATGKLLQGTKNKRGGMW